MGSRDDGKQEDFDSWREVRTALVRDDWEHVGGELAGQRWAGVQHWPLGVLTVECGPPDGLTGGESARLRAAGLLDLRLDGRAWRWAPTEDDVEQALVRLRAPLLPVAGLELTAHLRREQALHRLAAAKAVRVLRNALRVPLATVALLPPELQVGRYA